MALAAPAPTQRSTGDGLRLGFVFNLLGRAAVMVSGAGVAVLLARHYGAEEFGRWSVAIVYATLVGTLLDGGFNRLLIRDVARAPDAARQVLWNIVKRRIQVAAVALPVALVIAAFSIGSLRGWVLVALLVTARIVWDVVSSFSSVMFAFERFRLPNVVETIRRALLLAVVLVIVVSDLAIEWAAIASLILAVVGSGAIIRPTLQLVADKRATIPPSPWRDAAWFWLNGVLFWINAEVDQLMLSRMSGDRATGIYAAAVRLISVWLVVTRAVNDTVIRRWFRAANESDPQMRLTTFLLSGIGGILGTQFALFPREIIHLVYSARYDQSAPAFGVLGMFLAFYFMRCAPHWFISTSNRVPLATAFLALAATTNFVANLWLIPRYGALGSAIATAGSELMLVCLAYAASGKAAPGLLRAAGLGVLLTCASVLLTVLARQIVPWYLASAAGVALGASLVFLEVRRETSVTEAA